VREVVSIDTYAVSEDTKKRDDETSERTVDPSLKKLVLSDVIARKVTMHLYVILS
jgi:hypothetical protein